MLVRRISSLILVALLLSASAVPALARPADSAAGLLETTSAGLLLDDRARDEPAEADLGYPPAPDDSRRPAFVRQTGKNCAFASVSMLLDKWTGGRLRPSQARLRLASRVPGSEGVSFGELARAVARVTRIDLRYSPGGGDPLTWEGLMSRLARGGGAVIGGSYSRLPRHYQRWAPSFAALGAAGSGHAVYVERYQPGPGGGRVWLMDPLASGANHRGEWISARALETFAWRNGDGLVTAAATPEPPALAGYEFGALEVEEWPLAGGEVSIRLPFSKEPGWQAPNGLSLSVDWQLVAPEPDPDELVPQEDKTFPPTDEQSDLGPDMADLLAADKSEAVEELEPTSKPSKLVRLSVSGGYLIGALRAPAVPGTHLLEAALRHRDGTAFEDGRAPALAATSVRLHGPLAAELSGLVVREPAVKGSSVDIQVSVTNRGSLDWQGVDRPSLVASWLSPVGTFAGGQAPVVLVSGESGVVNVSLDVPGAVTEATLSLELVSAEGARLSGLGVAPLETWLRFEPEPSATDAAAGPLK